MKNTDEEFTFDNSLESLLNENKTKNLRTRTQDVHFSRRNGALYGRERRFTALIFTLFHRNPSVRITTAVSGRFSPVYSRLRAVLLDLGREVVEHDLEEFFI